MSDSKNIGGAENLPGSVAALWRYPVKSMLGEQREQLAINVRGVAGDRLYAVRNAEGKIGSGKNTRRFRKIDGLFRFRAVHHGEVPEIFFPDGWVMRADDPAVHAALSSWLGQPVTLAPEADVSHFDEEPIHIVTTASLAWIRAALPGTMIDERRFRPNLLLEVAGQTQIERSWIGKTIVVGDDVKLRVTRSVERCGMIALAQAELPEEPAILRCITQESDLQFGVYAQVIVPGRVTLGDRVAMAGK